MSFESWKHKTSKKEESKKPGFKSRKTNQKAHFKLIQAPNDHKALVQSVAWSPNSKYLATGSEDNTVNIYNTQNPKKTTLQTTLKHKCWHDTVAWSPNSKYLATGSEDNTVNIYEVIME